ncbi:SOS response-associated peptidase [Carboxylicivirga marina]|uniref:Abasic site processing protein n=1 Tax=Carboxylicivirga marina TaxID=2800988 RepID=A0ABS1HEU6_9BACT|nr:SOS response-associated peptidase [Carboxylicivirga marina]MBK3515833.1 SOS response-associated peptidase [Carboxylicivirga marina]
MCYTAKYLIEKALKRAKHYGVSEDIVRYTEELKRFKDHERVSGFTHPEIIIYTNQAPYHPILSHWGLIPHWAKNEFQAKNIWNKTLNARGETIFEKPAFKNSAKEKRCLIPVAGFYEFHHTNKKTIPYYVKSNDEQPLMLAGLWSEWTNIDTGELMNTCSIVTTSANQLMKKIHNNPKLNESRMPVILDQSEEDEWLMARSKDNLQHLIKPYPDKLISAKPYVDNSKKAPETGALPFLFDD